MTIAKNACGIAAFCAVSLVLACASFAILLWPAAGLVYVWPAIPVDLTLAITITASVILGGLWCRYLLFPSP